MSVQRESTDLGLDVAAILASAERLDPRRGVIYAEMAGATPRWMRIEGSRVTPCEPEDDRKLPLARALPSLRAAADVSVLAYRPGRRIVLRLVDAGGSRVVKGLRKGRLEEVARRHGIASGAWSSGPLRAPRVLDVDGKLSAFVLSDEEGRGLDLGRRDEDAFFRLGAGLRRLQACGLGERLVVHGPDDELAVLDGLLHGLGDVGGGPPPGWTSLREALTAARALLPVVAPLPCHRDLHDGQVLVTPHDLVVLDFDLLCRADPLLDAANLVAHLKLRELQGLRGADDRTVGTCGGELLEGLDLDREPGYRERLRFYQAATFLRLALLYGLRRRWRHLDRELLSRARRCLDDR